VLRSTLIIALYTLKTLCFSSLPCNINDQIVEVYNGSRKGLRSSLILVACLWAVVSLIVTFNIAADGSYHFYGPTGFWCWIQARYSIQRTATDFVFMWITAVFNIVIYIILFLYLRGYITTTGWLIYMSSRSEPVDIFGPRKLAYGLLFYPLVYTFAILPLSIARYSTFTHHHVPYAVTIVVDIIYLSNGLFNVLLFSITRPFLLPHDLTSPTMTSKTLYAIDTSPSEGPDDASGVNSEAYGYEFPRHESPTGYHQLQHDYLCDMTLRWSADGVASYEVNARDPSRESVGV